MLQRQLEAMRQTAEGSQGFQAGGARQAGGIRQRQCGKGVGVVMLARQVHLFHVQHLFTFHPQPGFALLTVQVIVAHINTETHAAFICPTYWHGQRIIGVHHADAGIFIDTQLGGAVLLQTKRIAIHMIFGNVEDGRCDRLQA